MYSLFFLSYMASSGISCMQCYDMLEASLLRRKLSSSTLLVVKTPSLQLQKLHERSVSSIVHDNSKPALEVTAYSSFSFRVLARL